MHENERIKAYQVKKNQINLEKMLEEEVRSERESVWEMNRCGLIERDRGNENQIAKKLYIDPQ